MKYAAIFIEIIVLLFMILFLYTGISKIMDYAVFKEQLAANPVLTPAAAIIARLLPVTEFLLVIMLIVPKWRLKGLYLSTGLMLAFTIYIIALMLFADHLPCSCGGVLAQLSWGEHIVFNSVFIVLGVLGIVLLKKLNRGIEKSWPAMDQATSGKA
jgi:uncharacterized membrane protein YphA (DoxX/SURF4 family)